MNAIILLAILQAPGQLPDPAVPQPAVPPPQAKRPSEVEARKEARDVVLRSVGPGALAFTKAFGDLGIYALRQVRPETAKRLVELFDKGELARLKNPRGMLEAVRVHGDPAAVWLVANFEQLTDPDALECFCRETQEYVFDLKDIRLEAERLREGKKISPPWLAKVADGWGGWNGTHAVIGVLALLLLASLARRRRRPAEE